MQRHRQVLSAFVLDGTAVGGKAHWWGECLGRHFHPPLCLLYPSTSFDLYRCHQLNCEKLSCGIESTPCLLFLFCPLFCFPIDLKGWRWVRVDGRTVWETAPQWDEEGFGLRETFPSSLHPMPKSKTTSTDRVLCSCGCGNILSRRQQTRHLQARGPVMAVAKVIEARAYFQDTESPEPPRPHKRQRLQTPVLTDDSLPSTKVLSRRWYILHYHRSTLLLPLGERLLLMMVEWKRGAK